ARERREQEAPASRRREALGQIEDVGEDPRGPMRIRQPDSWRDAELRTGSGDDAGQRVAARFPAAVLVRVQHRAGQTGASCQLGLGESGSTPGPQQQLGRGWRRRHATMLADTRTYAATSRCRNNAMAA